MKIAIIGGGWVGCHMAMKLKDTHDITIFEKNNELFSKSSFNNQNRLHIGYHYARNSNTRNLCKETFDVFLHDYEFLTEKIENNIYCVPETKSIIDYGTYIQIFNDYDFNPTKNNFNNIVGCINTNERYINFNMAKKFFIKELEKFTVNQHITSNGIEKLKETYDLVINCTNNHILDKNNNESFYELTITFLYKKIGLTEFDALTIVDGEFFSIYPYVDDIYTVTDVTHTPIKKFNSIKKLTEFEKNITDDLIFKKKELIENKIIFYFPEFKNLFEYYSCFTSTKSKFISESDNRYPIISKDDNLINCFTGKIQGIYVIEEYIKKVIKSYVN